MGANQNNNISFLGSATVEFMANAEALKMANRLGINANSYFLIGLVQVVCLILFIIPRTGILGTLLLASYMGGSIPPHLKYGKSIMAPRIVQAFLALVLILHKK